MLKEFGNYFKIISVTLYMLEIIHELQYSSEIISGKFPRAEIKSFQTDVDEGWNNFSSHVTTALSKYENSEYRPVRGDFSQWRSSAYDACQCCRHVRRQCSIARCCSSLPPSDKHVTITKTRYKLHAKQNLQHYAAHILKPMSDGR